MQLVDAQQARRVLDRLVGYRLSPFLWKKVRRGLSAGRVQSVALRLVAEREREIQGFVAQEYWSIEAALEKENADPNFRAKLSGYSGRRQKLEISSETDSQRLVDLLQTAAYSVRAVQKKIQLRRPAAPFITSTLQQEASRRLGFTARRTMAVAQQLYEGVSPGQQGRGGPHHLHADRLHPGRRVRPGGGAQLRPRPLRGRLPASLAPRLSEEGEGRPGGPRSDPTHFGIPDTGERETVSDQRSVSTV